MSDQDGNNDTPPAEEMTEEKALAICDAIIEYCEEHGYIEPANASA